MIKDFIESSKIDYCLRPHWDAAEKYKTEELQGGGGTLIYHHTRGVSKQVVFDLTFKKTFERGRGGGG